jgi:hypothetical protein
MNASIHKGLLFTGLAITTVMQACSFSARTPDDYRTVTNDLLATRADQLRACYDAAVVGNPAIGGIVVVSFTVEADTGKLLNPVFDAARTTAPEPLKQCITTALDGLAIDPPDQREGNATFSWEFKPSA